MMHLRLCRGFHCQAPAPNQFPLGRQCFATHRCYYPFNQLFNDVLVRLALFQTQYMPWFVPLFSGGAWVAIVEYCPHWAREKDSGVMAGGCRTSSCGSRPFPFFVFPIRIPRCHVRPRVYLVLDCPLRELADWSEWSWVRRRIYVRSDCRPTESADCVNWFIATYAWCITSWLVSEDRDSGSRMQAFRSIE